MALLAGCSGRHRAGSSPTCSSAPRSLRVCRGKRRSPCRPRSGAMFIHWARWSRCLPRAAGCRSSCSGRGVRRRHGDAWQATHTEGCEVSSVEESPLPQSRNSWIVVLFDSAVRGRPCILDVIWLDACSSCNGRLRGRTCGIRHQRIVAGGCSPQEPRRRSWRGDAVGPGHARRFVADRAFDLRHTVTDRARFVTADVTSRCDPWAAGRTRLLDDAGGAQSAHGNRRTGSRAGATQSAVSTE